MAREYEGRFVFIWHGMRGSGATTDEAMGY